MALVLLTAKITATTFTLSLILNKNILSSLLPLLGMLICGVVVFLFYFASYSLDYLQDLSFRRLLRSSKEG
jgi:ABC-type enterochelin transport system permease subunit